MVVVLAGLKNICTDCNQYKIS